MVGKYFIRYSKRQAAENNVGKIWIVSATALLVWRTGNGKVTEGNNGVTEGVITDKLNLTLASKGLSKKEKELKYVYLCLRPSVRLLPHIYISCLFSLRTS